MNIKDGNSYIINDYLMDGNDNYITNIFMEDVELTRNKIEIDILRYQIENYGRKVILEINGEEYIINFKLNYTIPEEYLIGDEKKTLEINLKIIYLPIDTYITQNVRWSDEGNNKAILGLGYTSTGDSYTRPLTAHGIIAYYGPIIYSVKLNEMFEISSEYENDEKWSILDTINIDEIEYGVCSDIYAQFFIEYNPYNSIEYTGKEYVYVKDTKTIYWLEKNVKMYGGTNEINIVYTGNNTLGDVNLNVNAESNLCTVQYYADGEGVYYQKYNISSPKLKINHIENVKVEIDMFVDGEKDKVKHYIGLFENETGEKTDKLYMIKTIDGNGSIIIDIPRKT